jgi:hypothetical protein
MAPWLTYDAVEVLSRRGYGSWVEDIDTTMRDLCARLELVPLQILEGGTMSAVIRCETVNGDAVVLKASPNVEDLESERRFLARLRPGTAPRILAFEPGALVLEFLTGAPERGLLDDAPAVAAFAKMQLWSGDDPGTLVNVEELLDEISLRIAARDLSLALSFSRSFPAVRAGFADMPVWCHGDLQGENVFWDGSQLRVIDPLPLWAPAGLDIGYWAADPLRLGALSRRLELLEYAMMVPMHQLLTWTTLGAAQHVSWLWHYSVGPDLAEKAEATLRSLLEAIA